MTLVRSSILTQTSDDRMAKYAGSLARTFVNMFPDTVLEIQRKMLEYCKRVRVTTADEDLVRPDGPMDLHIRTLDGCPVFPRMNQNVNIKKEEWVDLLRRYLNAQYSESTAGDGHCHFGLTCTCLTELASGHRRSHVPFASISLRTGDFIESKFLPPNFIFKDPHNMTKGNIISFCAHIWDRQEAHGAKDAFQFRQYHDGTDLVATEYGRRADLERAAERAAKQKSTRAGMAGVKKERKAPGKGNKKAKATDSLAGLISLDDNLHAVIDKVPADGPPAQGGDNGRVSTAQVPDSTLMIDPCLLQSNSAPVETRPIDGHTCCDESIIIDGTLMQALIRHGYPPSLPINGPNEGPPAYRVPGEAMKVLPNADNIRGFVQTNPVPDIDDRPVPRPDSHAHMQGMQEDRCTRSDPSQRELPQRQLRQRKEAVVDATRVSGPSKSRKGKGKARKVEKGYAGPRTRGRAVGDAT